jgi:predicted ATP-grasp superfamily ATP-dependent carboligase
MDTIKKIKFDTQPIMFVAWPDLGNVGILAIDYIRKKLNTGLFARIDLPEWYSQEAIIVKDGLAENSSSPECNFYFKKNPDIVIFESNARMSGKEGKHLIQLILKIASLLNVKYIFAAGGVTRSVSLNDKIEIKFASNNKDTRNFLYTYGFDPLHYGEIPGLSGILLTYAEKSGFNVGYFICSIPDYAYNWIIAYPKASLEIIKIFTNIIGVSIDYTEFHEDTKSINDILKIIDSQMQDSYQNEISKEMLTDHKPIHQQHGNNRIPDDVIDRIELLFAQVSKNKSLAIELKRELDKWKLFQKYEKRFLDLFKR